MATTEFKRNIEDFTCNHCGHEVTGDGYTNHCPECLWSKHVDKFPGDREESCGGMMKPIDVFQKHGKWFVIQKCEKCGAEWTNHVRDEDNFDVVIKMSEKGI